MAEIKPASLAAALIPLGFLLVALFLSLRYFGADSSYGPNQIALMLAACLALLIGVRNGHSWSALQQAVYRGMDVVFPPIFILLAVGMMIATWMAAGIVPALIYYGLKVMDPGFFYAASCLVCAIVSLSIGSSWTTAASVGVALIGTAGGLGLSLPITAGAIISGAYFGDKMSPLSDTTNLASAVADVELFSHIRHMLWTAAPSLALALCLFLFLGLFSSQTETIDELSRTLLVLEQNYSIGLHMLLPLLLLLALAWQRMPAFPAILIAAFTGALYAWLFQKPSGMTQAEFPPWLWMLLVEGYDPDTGDAVLDSLLGGGGAASMLNTIWLILSAVFFGVAMEKTGLLAALVSQILGRVRSAASLITATVLSCIGTNIITGDQYIAIVLPGRMYKLVYRNYQLAPVNLSRTLEDAATVTSPLVPWNTCGAYMAATLGVATLTYLPYCFFNLLMPLVSIAYGTFNFRLIPLTDDTTLPAAGTL